MVANLYPLYTHIIYPIGAYTLFKDKKHPITSHGPKTNKIVLQFFRNKFQLNILIKMFLFSL